MKLATQVLSKSVAIALEETENDEVLGTAEFCKMMNDYFDCTNVRSLTEHEKKRNPFLKPYSSQDDERFSWLKDVFLNYLETWKQSTMLREGNYTADNRAKMFLSLQTCKGLKIRVCKYSSRFSNQSTVFIFLTAQVCNISILHLNVEYITTLLGEKSSFTAFDWTNDVSH